MIESACIALEDFELRLTIGVHEREKRAPQRLLVSIWVDVEPRAIAPERYYDYDALAARLATLNGARIETQEEVALRIMAWFEGDARVRRVRLKLRKPDIFTNASGVGLDLVFRPDGAAG